MCNLRAKYQIKTNYEYSKKKISTVFTSMKKHEISKTPLVPMATPVVFLNLINSPFVTYLHITIQAQSNMAESVLVYVYAGDRQTWLNQ